MISSVRVECAVTNIEDHVNPRLANKLLDKLSFNLSSDKITEVSANLSPFGLSGSTYDSDISGIRPLNFVVMVATRPCHVELTVGGTTFAQTTDILVLESTVTSIHIENAGAEQNSLSLITG